MDKVDVFLIFAGGILIASAISSLQRLAVYGERVTLLDLLVPARRDPRDQLLFYALSVVIPLVSGLAISIWAKDKALVVPLATGLGAFLAVDTAFFQPDTLAPPLQTQISSVRWVYTCLIVIYGLFGYLGQSLFGFVSTYYEPGQVINGLITQAVWVAMAMLAERVIAVRANRIFESAKRQDEERLSAIERRLAEFLDTRSKENSGSQKEDCLHD
jgi:hypothetical protein